VTNLLFAFGAGVVVGGAFVLVTIGMVVFDFIAPPKVRR